MNKNKNLEHWKIFDVDTLEQRCQPSNANHLNDFFENSVSKICFCEIPSGNKFQFCLKF